MSAVPMRWLRRANPSCCRAWARVADRVAAHHVTARAARPAPRSQENTDNVDEVVKVVEKFRPRFWYAALMDTKLCSDTFTMESYRLEFKNGDSEYSVAQRGLAALFGVFFPLFLIVLGVAAWMHQRSWFFPVPVRFWLGALALLTLSTLCYLIHWGSYGSNGQGVPFLEGLAMLSRMSAHLLMWAALALIASGYGISFVALSERAIRENMIALGVAVVTGIVYLAMLIWYFAARDPASTVFLWDSGFAVVLLIFQCIFALWWGWTLLRTRSVETVPPKSQFYTTILAAYTPWFAMLPIIAIVASAVAPWYSERTALGLEVTADLLWFGAGLVLFNPRRAERVFDPLSLSTAADAADPEGPGDGFEASKPRSGTGGYDDL